MTRKILLIAAALCLLAGLPSPVHAGCGGGGDGGGGGEGRGSGAQSESSTSPTGYTPGATGTASSSTGGTASGSTWANTVISWDHDQVTAEAEAQEQRDLEAEAQRQETVSRFDQQALDQQAQDAEYSSRPPTQAERDAERAQHIREQLGNPDRATMAIIEHDFPTLDSQEAMIGIVHQMTHLEEQRDNLPPETYNAIRQELTGYYQDLQDAAAVDRFNAALDFGLSVAVNAGSGAVGGVPGFAIGFTYNLATGGTGNAATGTAVGLGSNALQSVVPGYAIVAPVTDAYAQNQLNEALK